MSDNNVINEVLVRNSRLEQIDFFVKACNSVCKIFIYDTMEVGSGFFIKVEKKNETFYCLISCEHVLRSIYINEKKNINVSFKNQNKSIDICLDDSKRFIREYTYMNIDATVVEIKPQDNIDQKYFLSFNIDYLKNFNDLENKNIFIIQYPLGGPLNKSEGKILSLDKYQKSLTYNASTDSGSSGSPIFLENTSLVIGLHKQGFLNKKRTVGENYGNFIGPIICSLMDNETYITFGEKKDYIIFQGEIKMKDNSLELFGKHFLSEGIYFFGKKIGQMEIKEEGEEIETHNNIIIYDNNLIYIGKYDNFQSFGEGIIKINNKIYYKGEFAFDKKEGNGTLYFDNGNYYIGKFNNDKMEGEGTIYNKDNNILYNGEFVNGKKCGNGTLINDKFIYEGQFKDDLCHGKGTIKFISGSIYEGDFVDNIFEGEGRFIYENGNCYIGKFHNNQRHGEGILFSKNNEIIYEGTFVDDEFDGQGTLLLEDGIHYIGDFKNGEKNGHGELYDKNNNIIFEGQLYKDKPVGSYKLFKGKDYFIGEFKS